MTEATVVDLFAGAGGVSLGLSLRGLETWEALLLMGMPWNHPLQGSRTAQFRLIGNGCCPPVVAAIVGELTGIDWRSAVDAVRGGR